MHALTAAGIRSERMRSVHTDCDLIVMGQFFVDLTRHVSQRMRSYRLPCRGLSPF